MGIPVLLAQLCILHILLLSAVDCRPSVYINQGNANVIVADGGTSTFDDDSLGDFEETDYYEDESDDDTHDDYQKNNSSAAKFNILNVIPPGLTLNTSAAAIAASVDVKLGDGSDVIDAHQAPDYMLELYERFSQNMFDLPESNIIRSFNNINKADVPILPKGFDQIDGSRTRFHTMTFNITSIAPREIINLAELRIFTLVERDRNKYIGVDRKVSVLEIIESNNDNDTSYRLLSSRHIYGRNSGWETFDVTSAVRRWILNLGSIQILEIRIESVFSGVSTGDMDINVNSINRKEPLLVVYSNDLSKKDQDDRERHEIVTHEIDSLKAHRRTSEHLDGSSVGNSSSSLLNREKRSRGFHKTVCKRRPMFVNFEDINWHTWIIAPRGYQAYQCAGKCYFPLSEQVSPSKHAVIQTLLHSIYPRKATRACCVPTKLEPISILYIDERGVITYKYKYDDMVVTECGCR